MKKQDIRAIIEMEGLGFSRNINLNGYNYTFTKNNSFVLFEIKNIEDVKVCHIKYIYFDDVKDLLNIMVYCCNFWQGNKVEFLFMKEKDKPVSAIKLLESLNFKKEKLKNYKWPYSFDCRKENTKNSCTCDVYTLCK